MRDAHRRDPLTAGERLNLGVSYEQQGEYDLALREYQRAERGAMRSTSLTYQGNVHYAMGEVSKAKAAYRAALEEDPDNVMALNNFAWLLGQEGESLEKAEELILHALSLEPEPLDSYENTLRMIREAREEE